MYVVQCHFAKLPQYRMHFHYLSLGIIGKMQQFLTRQNFNLQNKGIHNLCKWDFKEDISLAIESTMRLDDFDLKWKINLQDLYRIKVHDSGSWIQDSEYLSNEILNQKV